MDNLEISKAFKEIGFLLDIKNIPFKPASYYKVARMLELMPNDICIIYHNGGEKALEDLPGIGKSIAKKAIELIETGKLKYLEKLRKEIPVNVLELNKIEGIGPKTIKKLYEAYGVINLEDLEKVVKEKKINILPGFGKKSEEKILNSLNFFKKNKGRISYNNAKKIADSLISKIKSIDNISKIETGGSLRRKNDSIGDIDILIVSNNPKKLIDQFCKLEDIAYIHGKGSTKCSVKLKNGINIDIRIIENNSWGSGLQYFTGNKDHNIELRKIAQKKGLKLNEYGIFKGNKKIAGETEDGVYKVLGFKFIPPEERLNKGEFEKYKIDN